ncbi:hypothetical protein PR048_019511 [Dryococelus australis]|uniref:Transposase n=1 Tax=Dryococelus australis TaxID=614101 RepID=A0ABQ9H3P0_9NEOP|nr:hypothetical protein PR048_019511 [Dryococelus australis]
MSPTRKQKAAAALIVMILEKKRLKRRNIKQSYWVKEWIKRQNKLGACNKLLHELTMEDVAQFRNFIRMTAEDIEYLIQKLGATLTKQDTIMRNAIRVKDHIVVTLRFLASGDSYSSLQYLFRISVCTIGTIVKEVCEQLFAQLKEDYMKVLFKTVL